MARSAARDIDPIPMYSWKAEYGTLPDNYVSVDTETSGLDVRADYVLQLGFCVVKDRHPTLSVDLIIDWTKVLDKRSLDDLATRMDFTRRNMAARNKQYPWSVDMLRARGVSPTEAMDRLLKAMGPDGAVVGFYAHKFDYPIIGRMGAVYAKRQFSPDVDRMYDAGLMLKACMVGVSPERREDVMAYLRRIDGIRGSARHGLEKCVEMFGFDQDYGINTNDMHTSSYDAWITHLVFEKLRNMMPQQEN